ncbi:uncharacterized protein LOC104939274 [Larimichthys crocea]|uniref:uncharacterized protein LOC104939274 n=1 Tax=Larimichthys crocea TaxID=215358 RepID=UPI000F5E3296|nr:uncharacterized protein LOC104939274 [Larimichthys crocea]
MKMLTVFYLLLILTVGRCSDDLNFDMKTVGVGDDVNLTCARQKSSGLKATLFWVRLVSGNFPELLGGTFVFDYEGVNKPPRMTTKQEPGTFLLQIHETKLSDTGLYYCMKINRLEMTFLNATFLRIKGPEPDIKAVIQVPPSDLVRPGDSVTLQCSVLSDSENKTCPREHSVYWFRAGSDESYPSLIYAHGNSGDECERSPQTHSPQKCVYSFSKKVSSSDAGTYYCAVATCGEILFGNGTKLEIEAFSRQVLQNMVLFLLCALVLSLIIIALLIYIIRKKSGVFCNCKFLKHQLILLKLISQDLHHYFSKNISFLDAGTYCCAVATRKEIFCGDKSKPNTEGLQHVHSLRFLRVKMIVFCVTLLLLHQGYTLVPVTTVKLGEPVTFTCFWSYDDFNRRQLHWYKQSAGENLKLIVSLIKNVSPAYGPDFSDSSFEVKDNKNMSSLTILKTKQEDEGMYHCAFLDWIKITWSATYLSLRGNSQRTSNYTVVQWPTVSDPVRPGDSVTLQCSVLSDSQNKTCSEDHSVFWFRAGSDKSHPDVIYADGNRHDECDKSQKRCVYHFSKNVSSSDDGTYYCAVATCGEILFGNGSKLDFQGTSMCSQTDHAVIFLLCAVLAICLIVIVFLIHAIMKKKKCDCYNTPVAVQKHSGGQKSHQRDEDLWVYSAVVFTVMKTDRGALKDAKAAERERIYAAVKTFGLD